ncbi:MAG TPA: DUF4382 domain-containing protein [Hanamia sp.]
MKNIKKTIFRFGFIAVLLSLLIIACKKNNIAPLNNPTGPKNVSIYLTDDPCQYDSVLVDVKYIELKIDTSASDRNENQSGHFNDNSWLDAIFHYEDHIHFDKNEIWDTLNIKPGLYDIEQLRNGNQVKVATGNLPAGIITQMRLSLGTNNYVVISGVKHTLNLFHTYDNYNYVNIYGEDQDDTYTPGQTSMWLDFNICKSILEFHNTYYLYPFVRIFAMSTTGSVTGKVLPHSDQPYVTIWNATDTASALPDINGAFKIRGLSVGTYNVVYNGSFGYNDTTINNVDVTAGTTTQLPTINLHK